MPVPVGQVPPNVAEYLEDLERRLELLEDPQEPGAVFSCEEVQLPPAANYLNRVAYVSDVPILVMSDGTVWRRQDTGAAI